MGSVVSTFASDIAQSNTKKSRQKAHYKNARKNVDSKLKSIEAKAKERSTTVHDPLDLTRPYGLTEGMQEFRKDIWDLVFAHVNELDTIVSLREVCKMFRDLLETKYVAAKLPEIVRLCLERRAIRWKEGGRTKISNWVQTLSRLRVLSKSTKHSVNHLFDRGLLPSRFWSRLDFPYFAVEYWKIPHFMFGPSEAELMRLERTLESLEVKGYSKEHFPVKAMMLNEYRNDNLPFDRQQIRKDFQKCLEKLGCNITSFRYWTTNESPLNVYDNLRRWVALLPNLKELMVVFTTPGTSPYFEKVSPFPTCANLKRYLEGPHGFGYPYINEIFRANPTIEEVLLGDTSFSDLEVQNLKKVLDTVHLTTFHCTCMPTMEFFEFRFSWALKLTLLILRDSTSTVTPEIPSDLLFHFLSSFKNLKILVYKSSRIRGTGGYLKLPMLELFRWKIVPGCASLEFLKPAGKLSLLVLDISSCSQEFKVTSKMMEFLRNWHIPELFPCLKQIAILTETDGTPETIWKSSA